MQNLFSSLEKTTRPELIKTHTKADALYIPLSVNGEKIGIPIYAKFYLFDPLDTNYNLSREYEYKPTTRIGEICFDTSEHIKAEY